MKNETSGEPRSTREIALSCTTDLATQFHIHASLSIIVNGVVQAIPGQVGVKSFCMNPIHTHDGSGQLHIESPVRRDFTVDDFFAVWGETFSKEQILSNAADNGHVITMTVNGKENQDFGQYVLADDDQIVISYEATAPSLTP
ncbi:hypothetical protein HZA87_05510 [Candidatus Uhrbacteria bacterium]|nr:hypothetical protein [Candidatus Uhrbacteria bacterium]